VEDTGQVIRLTGKSLSLIFRGADVTKAVSGPVRITVMLGDTMRTGFAENLNTGITGTLNLLALISVSLFLMNLLPIPILDGGLIFFALLEWIFRRPVKPRILAVVQYIGIGVIALIFAVAVFSDIGYLRILARK
jgi:regulator of sigma E protease